MKPISPGLPAILIATLSGLASAAPDLLLVNGKIHPQASREPTYEAMAVEGGRVTALGTSDQLRQTAAASTHVVDLKGRTVLPGFNDQHVHPLGAGVASGACTIEQGASLEILLERVAACVDKARPGTWVRGSQWDVSALGVMPRADILDQVSPENPVILVDTSGHSIWVNSLAMQLSGVTRESESPAGGVVERSGDGKPSGVFREAAITLISRAAPGLASKDLVARFPWALEQMARHGVTSYTEAAIGYNAGVEMEMDTLKAYADEHGIPLRARICLTWSPATGLKETDIDALIARRHSWIAPNLSVDCIKIFLDGVPTDSHTAAMLEPYVDKVAGRDPTAEDRGIALVPQDELNRSVARFDRLGLTVKFHAAGDAAVRSALDAIEYAREENGFYGPLHDVGHVSFAAVEDLKRARGIGATLEMSPYLWTPTAINDSITAAVGEPRIARAWPIRDAFDAGALVVFGSDWAVVPSVNPWIAVETMITRERPGGSEKDFYGKGQAVTLDEALTGFTINAARHMGRADELGTLLPGYLADFVVLDRNPWTTPARDLHQTVVDITAVGGKIVYQRGESDSTPLTVTMFRGNFATVNSFVVSNGKSLTVIDVQRKPREAKKLIEQIRDMGLPLEQIFITHGHTDHFTGMRVFQEAFPDAKIVVANEAIKRDIKAYALYMDSGGETGAEPALDPGLKPRSEINPAGFDYENSIEVLSSKQLQMRGGGTLELTTDYLPMEADNIATVYSSALNALFLSDFGYNRVHLWLGDDISREDIANWRIELLRIKAEYAGRNPVIYPGHGEVTDMGLFDDMVRYIDDFLRVTKSASSREQAMSEMKALYPDYGEANFFLKYSVLNHVE